MTITLTKEEQVICKYLAKVRGGNDRDSGISDALVSNKISSYQTDLEGIGAEFAFCKMFNLFPDTSTIPRKGGYDCLTHDGVRVDVKANRYLNNAHLVVKKTKTKEDADVYVLMVGEFPTYRYAGFMSAQEILDDINLVDWGYEGKEAYSVHESQLKATAQS